MVSKIFPLLDYFYSLLCTIYPDRLAKQIQTMGIRHLKGKVKRAMEALRCPPPNADVTKLSGVCIKITSNS